MVRTVRRLRARHCATPSANCNRTDPSLAPPGHSTLYVLVPVTHTHPNVDWRREQAGFRELVLVVSEARMGVAAAVAAGFGAIISEVGAVQMVGGNIAGDTRVMTTAIVQFTRMGRYGQALGLALMLIGMIAIVNAVLVIGQTSAERYEGHR